MRVPVELPLQANHRLGYTVPGNSPVNARTAFASVVASLEMSYQRWPVNALVLAVTSHINLPLPSQAN